MVTRITVAELAGDLPAVLDRVRARGERFIVERDGEPVATLAPPEPPAPTMAEFFRVIERLHARGLPDDGFADDLEAVQELQAIIGPPKWPS